MLWTCEIQCAQHMISMKKQRFSSRRRTKVRHHGPRGSARPQPWPLEPWNCYASLFVNYYRFDTFYLWLSLEMHFISGGAFRKWLLTNENISKHSARILRILLEPQFLVLENTPWILLEFYVQKPARTMHLHQKLSGMVSSTSNLVILSKGSLSVL